MSHHDNPRKRGLGLFRGRGQGAKRPRESFTPPQKHSLPRDDCETLRLTEKDLGITEYISKYQGFNGVIKQRYVYVVQYVCSAMYDCSYVSVCTYMIHTYMLCFVITCKHA
jgi:hypothetical protein